MSTRAHAVLAAVAGATLLAGCGTATATSPTPAAQTAPAPPSLNLTLAATPGTWAVVEMGGSAAQNDNFWQLFIRPAGTASWKLATPPGTADNGGLVVAGTGSKPLISAIRPSKLLTYTPLIQTTDSGQAWAALSPLDARLASLPDALTISPTTGLLLALLASGTAEQAAPGYTTWTTLTSQHALAATPAGRRCGLSTLTAAAFTPSGAPMLAGTCTRPGTAGIFTMTNGTWQPAGQVIPAALARQDITVLRLTRTTHGIAALLAAGTGSGTSLLAAWTTGNATRWTTSPPLKLNGAAPTSASFGSDGTAAVILAGNRAETITSTQSQWQPLPPLPAGTLTLAPGPGSAMQALAAHRSTLAVWQLSPGGRNWTRAQVINVPIQYGSSG
jgi:hypothetical protein